MRVLLSLYIAKKKTHRHTQKNFSKTKKKLYFFPNGFNKAAVAAHSCTSAKQQAKKIKIQKDPNHIFNLLFTDHPTIRLFISIILM